MYVCRYVCICICVCTYACVCVDVCIHICMYVGMYIGGGELAQLVKAWGTWPWGNGYESQSWI